MRRLIKFKPACSKSYSDNDVNIVLRVRETGLYGWRAECPEKKTTKQPKQWGNIQQAEGIKKWEKWPTWTGCKGNNYLLCWAGGRRVWCKVNCRVGVEVFMNVKFTWSWRLTTIEQLAHVRLVLEHVNVQQIR
jgi:hypothetical protein